MACIVLDTGAHVQVLGGWSMCRTLADAVAAPEAFGPALAWHPAPVPGTAAEALAAGGGWTGREPLHLHEHDVWYRTELTGEGAATLRFEGLAGLVEVWFAGRVVARSTSMFETLRVAVDGAGELALCARSLRRALAGQRRGRWRPRLIRDPEIRNVRQTLLGQMPGWCPEIDVVGPYRPVVIERAPPPRVRLMARWSEAGAALELRVDGVVGEGGRVVVGGRSLPLRAAADGWVAAGVLEGLSPWWPHTHGEPALYPVAIEVGARRIELTPVGFRNVCVDRGPDGGDVRLIWNGRRVFCRGVVWTPPDLMSLGHPDATEAALTELRRQGANMVRLPGTGTYETAAFHACCDRLGLMVWQDFMFASLDYPADAAFRAHVAAEADELVERLGGSPSLAVLCGGSEVAQQAAMLGLPMEMWSSPLFDEVLASAAARAEVPYLPHSPGSPTRAELPFSADRGVSHYYGVGAYLRPLDDGGVARVRFASECLALAHVPDAQSLDVMFPGLSLADPAWTAGVPRDGGASWDFADVRDHYLERLAGVDPRALRTSDPRRYLDLSRAVSCAVVSAVYDVWRDPEHGCGGGLVWFNRDVRPGAGWGVVDHAGARKPVWHALSQAWAATALLIADRGLDGLRLCVLNETAAPLAARLTLTCLRDGRQPVIGGSREVEVAAWGAVHVDSRTLFGRFFDVTYAYRFGPPAHDVTVAELTDGSGVLLASAVHLPGGPGLQPVTDVGLRAVAVPQGDGWALTVTAERFAQYVHVRHEGVRADAGWFALWPGRARTIQLRRTAGAFDPHGEVAATNARVCAAYRLAA